MKATFYKYHGTGNDFILLDNRDGALNLSNETVAKLCHRRFGIGADGLMLLENVAGYDFKMVYYNADGNESSMCGNGGRCIVTFAKALGTINKEANFLATDGAHAATVCDDGTVELKMQDTTIKDLGGGAWFLDTGSPHFVKWVNGVADFDVFNNGKNIRQNPMFAPGGTNADFMEMTQDGLFVRTFERGVEDETLSCGTGVVAAAIASKADELGWFKVDVITLGGILSVTFYKLEAKLATNILLTGPAVLVFKGDIEI